MDNGLFYRGVCVLGLLACVGPAWAQEPPQRVDGDDLFRPGALKLSLFEADRDLSDEFGESWNFDDGTVGRFTSFSPEILDRTVADGVLRFRAGSGKAVLGWGHAENRLGSGDRFGMWPQWNMVELTVRQSAPESKWTVQLWQEGKTRHSGMRPHFARKTLTLKGTEWQTLSFFVAITAGDGFSVTIEGPADNAIEIDDLHVRQKIAKGYFRKEFDLPRGKVWRAVGEVGRYMRLYVNGSEVPFQTNNRDMHVFTAVDLATYLKPGERNCIAMSVERLLTQTDLDYPGTPSSGYFHGRVVMAGGETVALDTDTSWHTVSEVDDEAWSRPGLDESNWVPGEADPKYNPYHQVYKWPVHDGRIVLENPGEDPLLFFPADTPLRLNVRVPEGLAVRQPVLRWVLRHAAREVSRDALEKEAARGVVEVFKRERSTDSLLYEIDAGAQGRGVYTVETALYAREERIEARVREPLIVVGKIPMKTVAGVEYEEGMTPVLQDTIDFTNPDDPHVWLESEGGGNPEGVAEPRVVNRDGLVYRETGATGALSGLVPHFSYRFKVAAPHAFYLMVLEYPDDASRCIGVSLTPLLQRGLVNPRRTLAAKTGPAVMTGYKYPVSGAMKELRWVHYAYSSDQIVSVVSLDKHSRAAAARLRVYRLGDLPAMGLRSSGERFLGIHTERAQSLPQIMGEDDPSPYESFVYDRLNIDMVGRATHRLSWYLAGWENYAQYLRFSGQNIHVMGAFQYSEENHSYLPVGMVKDSRITVRDPREVALRVLAANDIKSMSMIEYSVHRRLAEAYPVNDLQVANGADTIFPVSKKGKQAGGAGCVSQACFDHPQVQKAYFRVLDELAEKFAWSPAWQGVYIMAFPSFSGPVTYAAEQEPLAYDYSDASVAAFESATGIRVPGRKTDPRRFEKRFLFLTSGDMREKWIDWRCQAVKHLVEQSRDRLQAYRRDLQLMYGYFLGGNHIARWCRSGRPYLEFLRDYGWDPTLFRGSKDIWTGRYLYPNDIQALSGQHGYAANWEHHVSADVMAAYDRPSNRLAVLNSVWHECDLLPPALREGEDPAAAWFPQQIHVRYVSQGNGDFAREKFAQAMIGSDPADIFYGFTDAMIPLGGEQALRQLARAVTPLPGSTFQAVDNTADFLHNLAIRALSTRKGLWFYVVNPGCWPVTGEITLDRVVRVVEPASGSPVATRDVAGHTVVPLSLAPYGILAFRAESGRAKIAEWRTDPVPEKHVAHLRKIMDGAQEALDTPELAQAVTLEDRRFLETTLAGARDALGRGEVARAWSALTNWRFWTLVMQDLRDAATYTAAIPGYTCRAREPGAIPTLDVQAVSVPPAIDGKLTEPVWAGAQKTDTFVSIDSSGRFMGVPIIATAAQAAYDGQHLYLAFTLADPDTAQIQTKAVKPEDTLNVYDDTVAMFFHIGDSKVYQLAVNAAGLRYNADATGQSGWFRDFHEDFGPWQAAADKTGKLWTLEVAIPFSTLKATAPTTGGRWRVNFLRRFRRFLVPEMYWAQIQKSWYETDHYGVLNFK